MPGAASEPLAGTGEPPGLNIFNIEAVEHFVDVLASRIARVEGQRWFRSTLRRFLLNNRAFVSPVTAQEICFRRGVAHTRALPEWVCRSVDQRRSLHWFSCDPADLSPAAAELVQSIYNVGDWLNDLPEGDRHWRRLSRVAVPEAIVCARRWHQQLARRARSDWLEDWSGIEPVKCFDDGIRFVRLTTASALTREGQLMRNCVGSYATRVAKRNCVIYSLRDSGNRPHATIEIVRGTVQQVQGVGNSVPSPKWRSYLARIIRENAWQAGPQCSSRGFLIYAGLIYADPDELIRDLPRLIPAGEFAFSWPALATVMRSIAGADQCAPILTERQQQSLLDVMNTWIRTGTCYRVASVRTRIAGIPGAEIVEARLELAGTIFILAERKLLPAFRQDLLRLCTHIGTVVLNAVARRPEILYRLSLGVGSSMNPNPIERFFGAVGLKDAFLEVRRRALECKRQRVADAIVAWRHRMADRRFRETTTAAQRDAAINFMRVQAPRLLEHILSDPDVT